MNTNFQNGTTLTAVALNAAFGDCLAADGSQPVTGPLAVGAATAPTHAAQLGQVISNQGGTINGGLYVTGAVSSDGTVYEVGAPYTGRNFSSLAAAVTEPGLNTLPLVVSFAPSHDRRNISSGGAASFSPANISAHYVDPTKDYGFFALNGGFGIQVAVATKLSASGTSANGQSPGYVADQPEIQQCLPTGYTNATLLASYSGVAVLPVLEAQNIVISTAPYAPVNNVPVSDELNVPSSVHNFLALSEGDIQKTNIDDAGRVGGYTVNMGPHQAPQAGGLWGTVFHSFRSSVVGAGYINYGLKVDNPVGIAVDSAGAVTPSAVVSAAWTAVPSWATTAYTAAGGAPTLTMPAPAVPPAAPASIGGGSVIHFDCPSPYVTQGGGILGFVTGLNGMVVSPGNPLPVRLNGNLYHVIGYQADGRWYEGGFLLFQEVVSAADMAVGKVLTRDSIALRMASGQKVYWEPTGTLGSTYYDPTQIGYAGAVTTAGNIASTQKISAGTGFVTSAPSAFANISAAQGSFSNGVQLTGGFLEPPVYYMGAPPTGGSALPNAGYAAASKGVLVWVADACKPGEASGSGTGVLACTNFNSNGWLRVGDYTALVH